MAELEQQLKEAAGARRRLIVTDGVFSMDGYVAPLREICDLADRYDAMVMVDDSHAVGFVGPGGRGTPELHGVMDRVDIITGTLGKALGGASGGYVAARAEIVALLRQRSRPYLFSNSLAPVIAAASLKVLDLLESAGDLRERLTANTALFRSRMTEAGFDILPGDHADRARHDRRRAPRPAGWPSCSWSAVSTSSASRTRSCRRARPGSASSCPPRTPPRTSSGPWRRSSTRAAGAGAEHGLAEAWPGHRIRQDGNWTDDMIDPRRLRILRAVADHRTVTAAASALYLTPSAVSQQLTALEQETGHALLIRSGKGVRLTAAGEILLSHTNAVLAQLERAEAELAAYAGAPRATVTVAAFATGIAQVVAPAIGRLAADAPGNPGPRPGRRG